MSVPKQPFKGIKEVPYPSYDMIQRWSSRDRAGEIRLVNETGKWKFDPPININDLEGDFQTEELVKYDDLNRDNFNVSPTNEVSLNIDYITLTNFSGADYIEPDPLPAAAILLSSTMVSTIEGDSVTLEVSLQREPTANVVLAFSSLNTDIATVTQSTLTFTPANYDTPQTLEINGIADTNASLDNTNIRVRVQSSTDSNYTNLSDKYISVYVTDLDTAGFTVSKTSMNIDEGTSSSFTVRLNTEPQADVEIRITSEDANIATIDTSSIVFTDTTWNTPVTVNVTAVEDSETTDQNTTLNVQVYQSLDPDYNSLSDQTINITSVNNDDLLPNEVRIGDTIWKTTNETWDDGPMPKHGYLYNSYVVDESENTYGGFISGMRIPTDDDWKQLEIYLGMSQSEADSNNYRGTNEGAKLAGYIDMWVSGTLTSDSEFNSTKFDGLPSGFRLSTNNAGSQQFSEIGNYASWWVNYAPSGNYYSRLISKDNTGINRNPVSDGNQGHSIRLVRDTTSIENSNYSDGDTLELVVDYDGNSYEVIKLGNQGWLHRNLAATHYSDGTSIPLTEDMLDWYNASSGAYCANNNDLDNVYFEDNGIYYPAAETRSFEVGTYSPTNEDIQNKEQYGMLYTWDAVQRLLLANPGYRLPEASTEVDADFDNTILNLPYANISKVNSNIRNISAIENEIVGGRIWTSNGVYFGYSSSGIDYYQYKCYVAKYNYQGLFTDSFADSDSVTPENNLAISVRLVKDI